LTDASLTVDGRLIAANKRTSTVKQSNRQAKQPSTVNRHRQPSSEATVYRQARNERPSTVSIPI
jgi:hypothetical protein